MEKRISCETSQKTLQSRPREHLRNMRTAPESDKDSGYSDAASECHSSMEHTDPEEGLPSSLWCAAEPPSGNPQPHPLVILKNMLVGQESCSEPHIHPWTVRPSFQLLPSSPQILLFPPTASPSISQTSCKKGTKYLPILNSYTKIAPQPSQRSPSMSLLCKDERGAVTGHHNQSKRPCPEAPSSDASRTSETRAQVVVLQKDTTATSDTALSTGQGNKLPVWSIDMVNTDSKVLSYETQQSMAMEQPEPRSKTRRFQNTLDVLHRSGLLSIAMKTKELARLNQATQNQLERLKEQMQLYAKAMSSNMPQDWQRLQDSLAGGEQECKDNTPFKEIDI